MNKFFQKPKKVNLASGKVCCPTYGNESWNQHPRVYINFQKNRGICPYCGTCFIVENSLKSDNKK